MGEEIETFLIEKLRIAITKSKEIEQRPLAELLLKPTLSELFEKLKKLLENRASIYPATHKSKLRKDLLYSLNDLLTEWQTTAKKLSLHSRDERNYAAKLNKKLTRIGQDLENEDRTGNTTMAPIPPLEISESFRWSFRHIDEEKVHGIDDKAKLFETLLLNLRPNSDSDSFKAFGILGAGGIGKTTLARLILNQPKVKQNFLPKIWVCMSKQPNDINIEDDRKKIVKRMLMCLGVEDEIINAADDTDDLMGLLFALRLELIGKRYLIILDDAWSMDKFYEELHSGTRLDPGWGEKLAYGLPKGSGGE